MNNWVTTLFKIWGIKNLGRLLVRRRRKNRGMLWASLVGIGLSAAALGLGRNRDRNMLRPLRYAMNRMKNRVVNQMPNTAAMTEFADEFMPDPDISNNK